MLTTDHFLPEESRKERIFSSYFRAGKARDKTQLSHESKHLTPPILKFLVRFPGNTRASIQSSDEKNHPDSFTTHIASIALIVLGADLAGDPLKEMERASWT